MKFIEVKEGVCIKKDEIIMIERIDGNGTRITTESTSVESIFPYETILSLLENDAIEEQIKNKVTEVPRETFNMWGGQHFAG